MQSAQASEQAAWNGDSGCMDLHLLRHPYITVHARLASRVVS
jgi:hypothetical protein